MKFGIASAAVIVGSASAYVLDPNLGRCHVYNLDPGNLYPSSCGYVCQTYDLDGSCGSKEHPCVSTMDHITGNNDPRCGDCYHVTYEQEDTVHECCKDKCAGYKAEVYIKITDRSESDAKFEMSQDAWAKLCPMVCHSSEVCTQNADECVYGVYPPKDYFHNDPPRTPFTYPGSCSVSGKKITYTKVEGGCGSGPGSGAPAPPTPTDAAPAPPAPTDAAPAPPPAATDAPAAPAPAPTDAPVDKPAGEYGCYYGDAWWFAKCDDPGHCKLRPEYKTEAECINAWGANAAWAKSREDCLAVLPESACLP